MDYQAQRGGGHRSTDGYSSAVGNAKVECSQTRAASLFIYCGRQSIPWAAGRAVFTAGGGRAAELCAGTGLRSLLLPEGCSPTARRLLLCRSFASPDEEENTGRTDLLWPQRAAVSPREAASVGGRMEAPRKPRLRRCLSDHPGGSSGKGWDGFWKSAREKRLAGQSKGICNPELVGNEHQGCGLDQGMGPCLLFWQARSF